MNDTKYIYFLKSNTKIHIHISINIELNVDYLFRGHRIAAGRMHHYIFPSARPIIGQHIWDQNNKHYSQEIPNLHHSVFWRKRKKGIERAKERYLLGLTGTRI